MNKPIVIAGFGGIGKTTLSKKYNNILDLESSSFKYIIDDELKKLSVEERKGLKTRKLNPDYPDNYYKAIVEGLKTYDIVLISVHKDIFKKLEDNNIEYIVVYPKEEMLDELTERCIERGNNKEYISKMRDAYLKYYPSSNQKVLWLNNKEYLEDILIKNNLLKEKLKYRSTGN